MYKQSSSKHLTLPTIEMRFRLLLLTLLTACILSISLPTSSKVSEEPRSFLISEDKPSDGAVIDGQQDGVVRISLGQIAPEKLLATDMGYRSVDTYAPIRFAIKSNTKYFNQINLIDPKYMSVVPDGRIWRVELNTDRAVSHNLGLTNVNLPIGAKFWLYNPTRTHIQGSYSSEDTHDGEFWSPIIEGDSITLELFVPDNWSKPSLIISDVNAGYRGFSIGNEPRCSENVDSSCSNGDPLRNQIRSVTAYTSAGTVSCTGQLVHNTTKDFTPYILSAHHCGITPENAHRTVFYWNLESNFCGDTNSGDLTQNQIGASFVASSLTCDFLLLKLKRYPDPNFNVFYAGWDARGKQPETSTITIHHPHGNIKSIAVNEDAIRSTPYELSIKSGPKTHWKIDNWESGITETHSSGSCLWDGKTKRCIGILTGSSAACNTYKGPAWYGKLSQGWKGEGTHDTSLKYWLDPGGKNRWMDGANQYEK